MQNPVVIIPARLASARLPQKPLALIGGKPMILHVLDKARAAALGPVIVATPDEDIAAVIRRAGGDVVLTGDHPSGTDRVAAALACIDPDGTYDVVVNLQGDEPAIEPGTLRAVLEPLADPMVDIATLAAPLLSHDATNSDVVKLIAAERQGRHLRAKTFNRQFEEPGDKQTAWRHLGVYAFRRAALERFIRLGPSPNERRARLEQLRALDAGMRIDAATVDSASRSVDTPTDLAAMRARFTEDELA